MPSWTRRSRLGVRMCGLPSAAIVSARWSSEKRKRIFGREGGGSPGSLIPRTRPGSRAATRRDRGPQERRRHGSRAAVLADTRSRESSLLQSGPSDSKNSVSPQYWSALMTSPLATVPRPHQMFDAIELLMHLTEPSAKSVLTPAGESSERYNTCRTPSSDSSCSRSTGTGASWARRAS